MLRFESAAIERDNEVVINGTKKYMLTDDECRKVLVLLETLTGNKPPKVSTPSTPQLKNDTTVLHEVEDKKSDKPIPGTKMFQGDFITVTEVDGKVRVYLHCPVKGDKGDKIRYALKKGFKDAGAKWSGNYKAGEFHWTFATKKQAQEYIKAEKARANKKG